MNFYVMTLFPEMIMAGVGYSILKRAQEKGLIRVECVNIREFSGNRRGQVDDAPYGGGPGMVMQPKPIYDAYCFLQARIGTGARVVYLTPQGEPFTQKKAVQLSQEKNLILLCGHYEGVDERIVETIVTDEISIGDYILTGGELAVLVIIDAVSRVSPGVLGKMASYEEESFTGGLLEYPQYTRPPMFLEQSVPDVLLSGNHQKIGQWRREQSVERTRRKRPDLYSRYEEKQRKKWNGEQKWE